MKPSSIAFLRSSAAGLGAVLATGALLLLLVHYISTPLRPVMVLERVVITGKSVQPAAQRALVTAQLPRVLIEGRSSAPTAPLRLATAAACAAPTLC